MAALAAFSELAVPRMGMLRTRSHASRQAVLIPTVSLPTTISVGALKS